MGRSELRVAKSFHWKVAAAKSGTAAEQCALLAMRGMPPNLIRYG